MIFLKYTKELPLKIAFRYFFCVKKRIIFALNAGK